MRSYLPLTTLSSCVHLTKISGAVAVESGFTGVERDEPAIDWVGLAFVTEKLPTHYIPRRSNVFRRIPQLFRI